MKIDKEFVRKNRTVLRAACIENATSLWEECRLLQHYGHYARAHFLAIAALEELAKAEILARKYLHDNHFPLLIDHSPKIEQFLKMVLKAYNMSYRQVYKSWPKKVSEKAFVEENKDRIRNMREDALYARLKETPNFSYVPDNNYWKKRYKTYEHFLTTILLQHGALVNNDKSIARRKTK